MSSVWYVIGAGIMGATALITLGRCEAQSATLRIERGVPTIAGIEAPPSPGRFYDGRQRRVMVRPTAGVQHLLVEAPKSSCPGAFEVISGPRAERGCYGGR